MREIIFRGKRIDTGEWVYGNFLQDGGLCFIGKNIEVFKEAPFNECLVNPDTVGQYTGLKDRNGKEIWEHDIVKYVFSDTTIIGEVVWWSQKCGFYVHTKSDDDYYELTHHCEVMMSVHSDPELLEDKK